MYLNENENYARLIDEYTNPELFVYNKFCKNKKFPESEKIVNHLIENNKFNWLDFLNNKNISERFKEEMIEKNSRLNDIMIELYKKEKRNKEEILLNRVLAISKL